MRSRNFVFTLNNYTPEDEEKLQAVECRFIHYGREVAPTTGTPHLQGYLCFDQQRTLSVLKKKVHPTAYFAPMNGSFESNYKYCSKSDPEGYKRGDPPMSQAAKGEAGAQDYDKYIELAKEGRVDELPGRIKFLHYRAVQYHYERGLEERKYYGPQLRPLWLYGATGTGKSQYVRRKYPEAYVKTCNHWWQNYKGQEVIHLEDFDQQQKALIYHLKIWADHGPPVAIDIKNGGNDARFLLFIVTSNYHPEQIWTADEDLLPILRRFEIVETQYDPDKVTDAEHRLTVKRSRNCGDVPTFNRPDQ